MFDQCLYFNTTALARTLEREWTKALKPFGLTPSQAFMLRAIVEHPGLLQSRLADALAISRSTATRTLDGLQKLGFVERWATESDRRESAIHPTEHAQAMIKRLGAASADLTRTMKRKLGAARFDSTVSNVRHIRTTLE
ncbi:MarR family winged helix-turn-helix transcriptional regulator [Caballeronia insecticola]|uniref:Putative Bacterial regulatory protein MarR n=1 Tax=Caballeronia insecticola TaxID=758793 RepID=R4X167_9BURK|nr:MarR family transcriptional regulator [Caballeronia insecticola]BAN25971.1 putative Bacterial regulatory protein MarR [Caballeronia insecticola]